ncbi:unnamed protein product, partial [Ectocarpus fasciculatus]
VGGDDAWAAAFEALSAEGLVKTSLGLEQRSLDDRLLDVQETYDFSAGSGYREGKPDEDEGARDLDEGKEGDPKTPEWPACEREAAGLRRDMQFAALRDRGQSIGELVARNSRDGFIAARCEEEMTSKPLCL